jgi:hypothetical protein
VSAIASISYIHLITTHNMDHQHCYIHFLRAHFCKFIGTKTAKLMRLIQVTLDCWSVQ